MMWRGLAGAGFLALAGFLGWILINSALDARERAGVMKERARAEAAARSSDAKQAREDLRRAGDVIRAAEHYAEKAAALEPVIVRSKSEVIRYAATDAGARPCLALDRVRRIEIDAAALGFDTSAAADGRTLQALATTGARSIER